MMAYEWFVERESRSNPGVRFVVRKMSLLGRMQLVRAIREKGAALEFSAAGESLDDKLRVAEITATMEEIYVRWGVVSIEGLWIGGEYADVESALEQGPESLCTEMARAVREECFLSEDERKN